MSNKLLTNKKHKERWDKATTIPISLQVHTGTGEEAERKRIYSAASTTTNNQTNTTAASLELTPRNPSEIANEQLVEEYSTSILDHMHSLEAGVDVSDNLATHQITQELRSRMVDWMIEVIYKTQCVDETLFVAAKLMDRFFKKVECQCNGGDLHVVGVACMVLATKYEEVVPLRLKFVQEKITHHKINAKQIKIIEGMIVKTLGFWFGAPTEYTFLIHMLELMFPPSTQQKFPTLDIDFLSRLATFLAKCNIYDYKLCSIGCPMIAAASIYSALFLLKIHGMSGFLLQLCTYSRYCECEILALSEYMLDGIKLFKTRKERYKKMLAYVDRDVVKFIDAGGESGWD